MIVRSSFVILLLILTGCGQKQTNIPRKVSTNSDLSVSHNYTKPKHKLIAPYSKDIYSTHKYARFMYQKSCYDLKFRKDDLYTHEMKYDPLAVIEILHDIDKDMIRNNCK